MHWPPRSVASANFVMEETKGTPKWSALLTVWVGSFITTLDSSIVSISFPTLTRVFETDPSVVLWVSVAYLLVSAGLMLTIGRIGDVIGRKRLYISGLCLFTVGLTLCSISQSIAQLIMARIVQGVGAAMLTALAVAILTAAFPGSERGKALGIQGTAISTGLLSGPVIGGFLLDTLGWRSIFYIRVPILIIALVMSWIFLKEQREPGIRLKLDFWGVATLFGGLTCLLLFFNLGGGLGFSSLPVLVLAGSAVTLLALFIMQERRAVEPVVDLNLFRNRSFSTGNVSLMIIFVGSASVAFLMPFYLIGGLVHSPSTAGLFMAVVPLAMFVVAPLSGWLSDKIDSRILCTVGIILVCWALFQLSGLGTKPSNADILLNLVLVGIGMGMFEMPNVNSIMGSAPKDRLGTVSAMVSTSRQVGMSTGIAVAGTIFTSRQLLYRAQLAQGNLSPAMLDRLSLISGFQDTFLFGAIFCSLGILFTLLRGKQKPVH